MASATIPRFTGKVRNVYLDLIDEFPLTTIRTERELRAAQKVLDGLLAQGKLSAGEAMYLDALSDLVAVYEDEHHSIEPASDADMLRHLMEARGINQTNLHHDTKIAKSSISEVLSGKKSLSRKMIRTLADYFKVDPSVLSANL